LSGRVKLSNSGVSLQLTKKAAGKVGTMREDIAMMWQKASIHRGGPLVGKQFVPFGKFGDMADDITTKHIHHQNAMLKTTKQRVVTNLNDVDMVIETEIWETANFGDIGFVLYKFIRHKQAVHIISSSTRRTVKW
jgi:hypothetical protein